MRLTVRVNQEFVLDAGRCSEMHTDRGREFVIRPPRRTLVHQLIAYLRSKPDPKTLSPGAFVNREGVAASALTLRWGSYLAVLLDHDKPVWPECRSPDTSRISDHEMARINIEASAAMAEWVDLCRAYWAGQSAQYRQLVERAICYLPMPKKTSKRKIGPFVALALPEIAAQCSAVQKQRLEQARAECQRFPSRVFADALINAAWRNGAVEDIHAGYDDGYPLDLRRMTLADERHLMEATSGQLAAGMDVCSQFHDERPQRSWQEQVLPYALAQMLLVTLAGWTLTESSCEVRLPIRLAQQHPIMAPVRGSRRTQ